jgi:YVTN family beta-propeller protein
LENGAGGGALVGARDLLLIDEHEPNNSCDSPQNLGSFLGSPILPIRVEGYKTQGAGDALDFYEFSATPGTRLRATLDGDPSDPNPLTAFGVGFFPSDCPATPSTSSFASPAQIEFTVPADGECIIGVTACCDLNFSGSGTIEGAYRLSVESSGTPTGQPRAYVLNYSAGTVSVIDTGNDTVLGLPITVNALPTGIAATPDGSRVYLTDDDNMVSVIETATNSVIGSITVRAGSAGIAIRPDGTRAYVTNFGDNSVSVIDTTTNTTVGAPIPVGANPLAIAITPDGARAYVANYGDNSVSVIDTALNTVIGAPILSVASWSSPCALAVTPDGTRVYVVNASGSAVVISTATNAVVGAPVPIGDMNLVCIAFTPDGTRGYVTYHDNTVAVFSPATNTLLGPPIIIPGLLPAPTGLAITPDGTRAYVANNLSNTVAVIDTVTNTIAGPLIDVGAGPFAVAIAPAATQPTPTRTATATRTPAPSCTGDCNDDRTVAINELITCVNIDLGNTQVASCQPCDADGDGTVKINELIAAVSRALGGCPS